MKLPNNEFKSSSSSMSRRTTTHVHGLDEDGAEEDCRCRYVSRLGCEILTLSNNSCSWRELKLDDDDNNVPLLVSFGWLASPAASHVVSFNGVMYLLMENHGEVHQYLFLLISTKRSSSGLNPRRIS
ncbi:hypothetical protein ACH5RR_016863 [Cinchona calisaya]|uniref:F-box protein n=1 Tax=Cinchona calisaya TaxID=153742 RepID=A0ABD2ZY91_9GENT